MPPHIKREVIHIILEALLWEFKSLERVNLQQYTVKHLYNKISGLTSFQFVMDSLHRGYSPRSDLEVVIL
jgi:hypothetical protein